LLVVNRDVLELFPVGSRSRHVSGTTPNGKKFKNVAVYDKQ